MLEESVATVAPAALYNGWSNRETWLANLWLTNDRGLYDMLMDVYSESERLDIQAEKLADRLHYTLNEECLGVGFWTDLIRTAFCRINWLEVVENNRE